jgi:hypothetical protein
MSNYLTRFATLQEYTEFCTTNILFPNVTYVDEVDLNGNHIHILKERYKFGDILMYDKIHHFKFATNIDIWEQNFKNNNNYETTALCVIPTGLFKDIYNDNAARFISLKGTNINGVQQNSENTLYWNRNETSADHGSSWSTDYPGMYDYQYGAHLNTDLPNRTQIKTWGSGNSAILGIDTNTSTGRYYYSRCPIERHTTTTTTGFNTQSTINTNLYYYVEKDSNGNNNTTAYFTRPLLLQDWTLNPDHFNDLQTSDYLKDVDGFNNTQYLVSISADSYTYDSTIGKSQMSHGCYAAALGCYRYSTIGVPQGFWYLPSITELSVGFTRFDEINVILNRLGAVPLVSYGYWSSTEYNANNAVIFYTGNGTIYGNLKYHTYYVRPFCRI